MPRFFFQIDDFDLVPDVEGTELPDLTAACGDAVDILAERLKGSGNELWQMKQWELDISDATGTLLAKLIVTADLLP